MIGIVYQKDRLTFCSEPVLFDIRGGIDNFCIADVHVIAANDLISDSSVRTSLVNNNVYPA